LSEEQLRLLASGTAVEQQYLLWIAGCKCFRFVHDFVVGVLREKFLRTDLLLTREEYTSYSRFTLTPSKYAVHINAFRKLLNRPRWAILDNLFILHQYFFGRSDDFS
jgi:hypothetical protein